MATSEIEQLWISQFQENLGALRKVAGWTTQQLANELGVARQTISNLETGRSPMTKLQYLALRTVFSAEIAECGNRELAKIIKTLVDDPIELRIKELGTAGSSDDAKEPTDETADNTKANSATEPDAPSEADDARPVAPASKPLPADGHAKQGTTAEHGHAGTCRHHRGSGQRHRRRRSHLSAVSQRQARQKRQTLTERTALQTATRPIIDSRTDSA